MKLRATVSTLLLSLALPVALTATGLAEAPFAEGTAAAQPPPTDTATRDLARQRYKDGVAAFDAHKYDEASNLFLQAYAIQRAPVILLNLGQSELKAGHWDRAGNHLQQFLREDTSAAPEQRDAASKSLEEAKHKSGAIQIMVDVAGADLSLDGNPIGKSPMGDAYLVTPGKHTLLASAGGKTAVADVDVKLGKQTSAALTLGGQGAPVPIAVPAGTEPIGPVPGTPEPPPMMYQPPPMFPQQGLQNPPPYAPPPDQGSGERQPFLTWYLHKPVAWLGTGVAIVGLVGGVALTAAASSASSTADAHAQQIRLHANTDPVTNFGKKAPCGSESQAGLDLPGYANACGALRTDLSQFHTDTGLATAGWVIFGVGAAGTVVYALVDWLPKKKATGGRETPGPSVAVLPVIGPTQRGVGLVGTF